MLKQHNRYLTLDRFQHKYKHGFGGLRRRMASSFPAARIPIWISQDRTGQALKTMQAKNPMARHGETQDQPHCVKFIDPPNRKRFAAFLFEVRQHGLKDKRAPFNWPMRRTGSPFVIGRWLQRRPKQW